MRRTCSINFIAEEAENNLTNIDNLLSINKRIKIFEGIKNNTSVTVYNDIIWFPLGVFVITQPSITHNSGGCTISLSCKDKMCLLNGECGGNLPTSVTFHAYDQIIGELDCGNVSDPQKYLDEHDLQPNDYTVYSYGIPTKYKTQSATTGWVNISSNQSVGTRVEVKQTFYDIIQTLVHNFGNESLSKIFINDVPLEIKQIVRQTGNNTLYYNTATGQYTINEDVIKNDVENAKSQREFNYNEDVGYIYTPFTYADLGGGNGELISNIGDNVCTILDKVKSSLGNFEYFYDIKGNFIFQEIRNYLNNSYDATEEESKRRLDEETADVTEYGLCILDNLNYAVDFYSNRKSVYTFDEGSGLITAYSNSPNYNNLKNDYHIQGKAKDNYAIHYHLAIKKKPSQPFAPRNVVFIKDADGQYTGSLRLATASDIESDRTRPEDEKIVCNYTPDGQSAELYLQGLEANAAQQRPDVYQQELLDLFDSIYDFRGKKFKADIVKNPNTLKYYIDYLDPSKELFDCSVDTIGQKIYSYQKDNIKKLYNMDIPNIILVDLSAPKEEQIRVITRCAKEGQSYSNVDGKIYANTTIGTMGYTAQEISRDLLYQYTNYAESISIQSIPIYYLEPNTRITVYDKKSGISGDYIIKNISLPLDAGGNMSISATRAFERI